MLGGIFMVTFQDKQILIDGKPVFLLSGEMHYFRQPRENWQNLLDEAKKMGLNCISSYVPWILHEETEGDFCFEDSLDLGAFIDLCQENGLYFFVRPGPYIMAEMKKEGIPYWVAKKYPDALPVGFDGEIRPCNTMDYLHPGYLSKCRVWYQKVMEIIVPRLQCNGGNIIGVQLDNEIGMLNWVTNYPVLNDHVLELLIEYLEESYVQEELRTRYPFWKEENAERFRAFRSPKEEYSLEFHQDFGKFMRQYYARYVKELKGYAEECGVHDTPFFINIHGTGEGRIFDFPLGVSQLYEAYNQDEGMIAGTDVYLGEPTEGKYQDLYVINAITDSMNKKGNPLTSIEFESGDAPYCSLNGMRYHPTAVSHKMLMCLSQNARMLSFYVFSGGENYFLNHQEEDGNGRMAFTGQLHGFNAPVQPDGTHNYAYNFIADTAKSIHALNSLIASSEQVLDSVSMAFIPDYFLTEAVYDKSDKMRKMYHNLKRFRCEGQIDQVGRALLGHHISFDAVDVQNDEIPVEHALVILSARYMPRKVQQKIVSFLEHGGKVLLYGEIPTFDMEGNRCTALKDAMGLGEPEYIENNPPVYFLSMDTCGSFGDIVPMQCGDFAQLFTMDSSGILKEHGSGKMCGMIKQVGQGKICAVTGNYPAEMRFWGKVFEELKIYSAMEIEFYRQGIYASRTRSKDGQELLYLINLDYVDKKIDIKLDGEVLFRDFCLESKKSLILPLDVKASGVLVEKSTGEIIKIGHEGIVFRLSQPKDEIWLRGMEKGAQVLPGNDYTVEEHQGTILVRSAKGPGQEVYIRFQQGER